MSVKLFRPRAIGAAALLIAAPLAAHHSTALFQWGKETPIVEATVTKWVWTNPHTFLYVKVTRAGGKVENWAFEGMSPSHLARAGWSKRSLTPGDVINLTYYPLRDARKGGFNVTVTKADGTVLRQLPMPVK